MNNSIRIFSPATVANVACGFDILGFALENPGDEIIIKKKSKPGITIINKTPYKGIPLEAEKNTIGVAIHAFLAAIEINQGFEVTITHKIKPGSGIGSSAASSVAGVFGVNQLLDEPLNKDGLVKFAMFGEKAACGSAHADNVAPALLGGFILVRSYQPLDIIKLDFPEDLYIAIVHPQIELKTEDARKILRTNILLKDAVKQWGNIAGLIAGLARKDYPLIARSLEDVIIEPVRSLLIPGYDNVKKAAIDAGALGCSISGSGPSVFALCQTEEIALEASRAMQFGFSKLEIESVKYNSKINLNGAQVVE
ncbi:MAG: homoserine kinase [Bacteroidota bacterium]